MAKKKKTSGKNKGGLSPEIMSKLRELSEKERISTDELVQKLLKSQSESQRNAGKSDDFKDGGKQSQDNPKGVEINADFSKIFPLASMEIIDLLRRITVSMESIEKSHDQGWRDQRTDLNAIVARLDKVL